ncbi:polysaccharide lyase [Arsukibacterium sp.]|uniref:polysaccharide lyase n=1 Tax=Arsukibacterium sp. TaxID=1977258 RepID=UPI00299E5C6F|nr:hypothetical protein [Arsukibacterium sp.]MDX1538460.1 hypothetical protein [Arsukibacterium sp.]
MLNQKSIVKLARLLVLCLLPVAAINAAPLSPEQITAVDWHEGDKQLAGASRSYSYAAAYISWPGPQMGVWIDKNMQFLGEHPFDQQRISRAQTNKLVSWQVTGLVQHIVSTKQPAIDLILRGQDTQGTSLFHSKESAENKGPTLTISTSAGRSITLTANMDTYLDESTFRSLGHSKTLKAGTSNLSLLRFTIPALTADEQITAAELKLIVKKQFGTSNIGVFWLAQPLTTTKVLAPFPTQKIVFQEDFSNRNWAANWSSLDRRSLAEQAKAPQRPDNIALKVEFNPEQNLALNLILLLKSTLAQEPEALYFQYDLYLADNWLATKGGGKFPGLAGTYNKAGWGGRSADGSNGWSARGQFGDTIKSDDKFNNSTPLGFYAYYPDNGQNHGAAMYWDTGNNPIKPGKWYQITQYVKLNTPGKQDGVLKAWVDQKQVFARTDIRFRDTSDLKIERLWLNFYHGGTAKPVQLMELYIDNVILATE